MTISHIQSTMSPSKWEAIKSQGLLESIETPSDYAREYLMGALKASRFIYALELSEVDLPEMQVIHALMFGNIFRDAGLLWVEAPKGE